MDLYLTTQDGRTLGLKSSDQLPLADEGLHLYQEIIPFHPWWSAGWTLYLFTNLSSKLQTSLITVPAITFVELQLGRISQ
jgi:hypothetical protein